MLRKKHTGDRQEMVARFDFVAGDSHIVKNDRHLI
jgi:hypothetical protein